MSIKLTLVENHINRNFKQYNIDDFTIKENFGSIENFKTILSKKRSKEDEANLIAFLNEIRPINKLIDMRKNNHQTTIHTGYVSSSNWFIKKIYFKFLTSNKYAWIIPTEIEGLKSEYMHNQVI